MASKKIFKYIFICLAVILCGVIVYKILPLVYSSVEYSSTSSVVLGDIAKNTKQVDTITETDINSGSLSLIPVTHISTPASVRAIYVSSWTAGASKYRDPVIKMIDETELNSIVVDIKDSTGRIGFTTSDPELQKLGASEKRIPDIRALTNLLHKKNIYVIGRISVFQDPYLTKKKPEWAITKKSDGTVWKDRKGLSFLDPANKEVWKYTVALARDSYAQGFDEINFDYIRYPSDGNIKDINYRLVEGKTRADNLESFFKYLSEEVKKEQSIPISADLFGLTTEVNDDMGIGQVWEKALPHFDFLAPMVYPSHYPSGHNGYKNPALYPYEVINKALIGAAKKTVNAGVDIKKIRPWLQDFDLGATYTKEMVRKQIQAVYDNKLSSWMLWDANNRYTSSALELEIKQ